MYRIFLVKAGVEIALAGGAAEESWFDRLTMSAVSDVLAMAADASGYARGIHEAVLRGEL